MKLLFLFTIGIILYQTRASTCVQEWQKVLGSSHGSANASTYSLMFEYSGFDLNNLGNYEGCNKLEGARYTVISYSRSPVIVQTFCAPKECTEQDYVENTPSLTLLYNQEFTISYPKEYQDKHYSELSRGTYYFLFFIIAVLVFEVCLGFMDYFMDPSIKTLDISRVFLCFSMYTNAKKLFAPIPPTKTGFKDPLDMINGIRVMSIGWIILGHTCQLFYFLPALKNYETAFDNTRNIFYYIAYGGFYAVDTFFWVAGFLVTNHCMHDFHKSHPKGALRRLLIIFFHRYLLLSPAFFFLTFFFWTLQEYLGSGPLWVDMGNSMKDCSEYLYTNFIYLNNFIPNFEGNACLIAGWYIACDIQFLLLCSLIILIYARYSQEISWMMVPLLLILSVGLCALIASYIDLNASFFAMSNGTKYFNYYYNKPYCRIAPYTLGMGTWFVYHSYNKHQKDDHIRIDNFALKIGRLFDSKMFRYTCFVVGLVILNCLMLLAYRTYSEPGADNNYTIWSKEGNWLFLTFERLISGVALTLIILPLAIGFFKPISRLLSMYPFVICSRLNYAVFLIHMSVIEIWYRSRSSALEFDLVWSIIDTLMFFCMCQTFAIPIVLMIEYPIINLERLYLERFDKYRPLIKKH